MRYSHCRRQKFSSKQRFASALSIAIFAPKKKKKKRKRKS
jgi:hypothetical protein